ncbi:MAG TPA: hypothetical protein VGH95_02520 [Candidatus Aquirickettsiella sp.]|jgi:hypothetical protein
MNVGNDKWPKNFSELNEEQKWIRDDLNNRVFFLWLFLVKVGLGIRLEEKFLYKEFLKKDNNNLINGLLNENMSTYRKKF